MAAAAAQLRERKLIYGGLSDIYGRYSRFICQFNSRTASCEDYSHAGGLEYTYGPTGNISVQEFYQMQRNGNFAQTSQINPAVYLECFEPCLCQGIDIMYLCFSSGMSGTFQSACLCVEELKQKYPERNIVCIDTLCASVGKGFFVREAIRKQKEGFTIEELTETPG